jgi:hypothetical protein
MQQKQSRERKQKAGKEPSVKAGKPRRTRVKAIDKAVKEQEDPYRLPRGCDLDTVKRDMLRYQCFEFERCVYVMRGKNAEQVANFTCTINTHMMDQEQPTKLITILNQDREKYTIEVPSESLLSIMGFRKAVDVGGNFVWTGTEGDYMRYQQLMKDRMAKGRKVEIMGRQREGFYAFCNAAVNGSVIEYDHNGCFELEGQSFYVPSGNKVWANDESKSQTAKLVRLEDSGVDFETWNRQLRLVHGDHAILTSLFSVAGLFCNELVKRLDGFPILFLYGQPGSGKDQVVSQCQHIFGRPVPSISLTGPNTDKAQVAMLAEVDSIPVHLAEYRAGMQKEKVEFCKAVWDRRGYKRRDRNMGVSTNTVPIRAFAFMSGNDYPNADDALLTRLIVEEMNKTKHSLEERQEFNKLKAMQTKGYSSILVELWKHRDSFLESVWHQHHPHAQELLDQVFADHTLDSRMLQNCACLLSTFLHYERKLNWSFNRVELLDRLKSAMVEQQRKRSSSGEVSAFWTCFIYAVRERKLELGVHFKFDQSTESIMFYWNEVFPIYAEMHRRVFNEPGRNSATLLGKMEHHDSWLGNKKSTRIGDRVSTAYAFDYTKTGTDLLDLLMKQPEQGDVKLKVVGTTEEVF